MSAVTSAAAVATGARAPKARIGDRREVFDWMMYSWAFHGFVTTVATVILGPYLKEASALRPPPHPVPAWGWKDLLV